MALSDIIIISKLIHEFTSSHDGDKFSNYTF